MKDFTVLEALKRTAASKIENAFERDYEQGYNDCKVELTEEEAKAHYDEGHKDGYEKGSTVCAIKADGKWEKIPWSEIVDWINEQYAIESEDNECR